MSYQCGDHCSSSIKVVGTCIKEFVSTHITLQSIKSHAGLSHINQPMPLPRSIPCLERLLDTERREMLTKRDVIDSLEFVNNTKNQRTVSAQEVNQH